MLWLVIAVVLGVAEVLTLTLVLGMLALGAAAAAVAAGIGAGAVVDALVFVADRRDDATRPGPTIRVLPAALDLSREAGPRGRPVVLVTAADGVRCRFEVPRAGPVMSALRRLYPSS